MIWTRKLSLHGKPCDVPRCTLNKVLNLLRWWITNTPSGGVGYGRMQHWPRSLNRDHTSILQKTAGLAYKATDRSSPVITWTGTSSPRGRENRSLNERKKLGNGPISDFLPLLILKRTAIVSQLNVPAYHSYWPIHGSVLSLFEQM
jgi:hypothetical protein